MKRVREATAEVNRAVAPDELAKAQDKLTAARTELANSEGPPTRPGYHQPGTGGPTAAEITAQHEAAVAAHTAAIGERIHAEGTTPTPDTRLAALGKVFTVTGASGDIIRGQDASGNTWTGTRNVLLKGHAGMERAANAEAKKARSTERPLVATEGLTKVTTPDPKGDYQPVTWERQVTDAGGTTMVLGTKPDGTFVSVQKPIYDALHAAAGPDGSIRVGTHKGADNRLWAHNAQGEVVGVGMPRQIDQAQAKIYARGQSSPPSQRRPLPSRPPSRPRRLACRL